MNTNNCKPHDLCETPPGCCEEHELYVCAYHEQLEAEEDKCDRASEQYNRAVRLNYD